MQIWNKIMLFLYRNPLNIQMETKTRDGEEGEYQLMKVYISGVF